MNIIRIIHIRCMSFYFYLSKQMRYQLLMSCFGYQMEKPSFNHDFSKVRMLRKPTQDYLNHAVRSCSGFKSHSFYVLDVCQSQCMIWVDLTDKLHCLKDYNVSFHSLDKKAHLDPEQSINIVFQAMRATHRQISSQFNKDANTITILSPSEQAQYFQRFMDKLTNRNIFAFFFPFQTIELNKNIQINSESIKKVVFSKQFFKLLGIGVNQTCVNIKKYGLFALQIFSTNLAKKIISQYKFSLKHYNKAFISNQITRSKLQPISSSTFEEQIKIKRQASKNIYDILKVNYEIFVPGPGIIIIEVIQKGLTPETVNKEREQFQQMKIIYEQKFNEIQSLNHIVKLPHSKMMSSNNRMCSYREISHKK